MKTYLKKSFICLSIILLTLSCFCCTSVQASVQPRAYYITNALSFSGNSHAIIHNYDGNYMAIEANATSSSGASYTVTINVFIYSRNVTETYTLSSNGTTKKFDYIYLGNEGSSDVGIMCFCNSSDTITIGLTSYSW